MEHPVVFALDPAGSAHPELPVIMMLSVTVTPSSVRGRATIFDADILIFCISQLMAALNAGKPVARKLTLTAHDLLLATGRETSGDSYRRLKEAFERSGGHPDHHQYRDRRRRDHIRVSA